MKWVGSELFEADTIEEALLDAVRSEYEEVQRTTSGRYFTNMTFVEEGFGVVGWVDESGTEIKDIITMREWKGVE